MPKGGFAKIRILTQTTSGWLGFVRVCYFVVFMLATVMILSLTRVVSKYAMARDLYQNLADSHVGGEGHDRHLARSAVPIQACPGLMASTDFAVVSMLTVSGGRETELYKRSLHKLGTAIQFWSDLNAVLLIVGDNGNKTRLGHWAICRSNGVEGPHITSQDDNRFLKSKMYSKLLFWLMEEYRAILYVDADTLLVRQYTNVFSFHVRRMVDSGLTIGMGTNNLARSDDFNAGVILLIPNRTEFQLLITSIHTLSHDVTLAEQNYLNQYYKNRIYKLPFEYNAMVSVKTEYPVFWQTHEPHAILLHYTCKPWHPWNCIRDGIEDLCILWYWVWPD
jgi:hypothetical protein